MQVSTIDQLTTILVFNLLRLKNEESMDRQNPSFRNPAFQVYFLVTQNKPGRLHTWPKRLDSWFKGRDVTKLKKGKRPKTSHVVRVCVFYNYGNYPSPKLMQIETVVYVSFTPFLQCFGLERGASKRRFYASRMIRGTRSAWTTFLGLRPLRPPGGFCCREVPEGNGAQFGLAVEKSKELI